MPVNLSLKGKRGTLMLSTTKLIGRSLLAGLLLAGTLAAAPTDPSTIPTVGEHVVITGEAGTRAEFFLPVDAVLFDPLVATIDGASPIAIDGAVTPFTGFAISRFSSEVEGVGYQLHEDYAMWVGRAHERDEIRVLNLPFEFNGFPEERGGYQLPRGNYTVDLMGEGPVAIELTIQARSDSEPLSSATTQVVADLISHVEVIEAVEGLGGGAGAGSPGHRSLQSEFTMPTNGASLSVGRIVGSNVASTYRSCSYSGHAGTGSDPCYIQPEGSATFWSTCFGSKCYLDLTNPASVVGEIDALLIGWGNMGAGPGGEGMSWTSATLPDVFEMTTYTLAER